MAVWAFGLLVGPVLLAPTVLPNAQAASLSVVDAIADSGLAATVNDSMGNTVVEDFNGDGIDDLVMSQHQLAPGQVYRGAADGTFALVQELTTADRHGCASADFDRDGRPDLYCAIGAEHGRIANKSNELWLQDADGVLQLIPGAWGADDPSGRGRDVAVFDADLDGFPDLYVGNGYPNKFPSVNRLYRNVAGTGFIEDTSSAIPTTTGGLCAAPADFDQDGFTDLFACSGVLKLWHNDAGLGMTDVRASYPLRRYALAADWGDLDGDGDLDLVTVAGNQVAGYLWTGATFVRAFAKPLQAGRDVALADVDQDGYLDLYVVQGRVPKTTVNVPDQLWLGTGTGATFTAATGLPQAEAGGGSDVAVLPDYSGRPALVVTNGGDGGTALAGPRQLLVFSP